MKSKLILLLLLIQGLAFAQNDSLVTLEEIWKDYKYFGKSVKAFNWYTDTTYSVLKSGDKENYVLEYGVQSGEVLDTLFKPSNDSLSQPSDYWFSEDKSRILLEFNSKKLYRRSSSASHYVYDIAKESFSPISENGEEFNAQFSPDGLKVAFTYKNNLYYYDVTADKTHQLTTDGKWNHILNGRSDWVYEEEFEFTRAFFWSPDSKHIAYLKFDESQVPEYNMQVWGKGLYPEDQKFKYPKAGDPNAKVSLVVSNLKGEFENVFFQEEIYIPRVSWVNANLLSFQTLNRQQNNWVVTHYNLSEKVRSRFHQEINETYQELGDVRYQENSLFFTSEQDGFNHIYCKPLRGKLKQITNGNWEVKEVQYIDKKYIYYTSNELSSLDKNLYRILHNGRGKECLTPKKGTHRIQTNGTYIIDYFSSANEVPIVSLKNKEGKLIKVLEDNAGLKTLLASKKVAFPEFMTINGLNACMIKPLDFDPSKKYPVLQYVYGGPGSNTVLNMWSSANLMWYQTLLEQGYIIVSVDNRGTGGRGEAFKKSTYGKLGKLECEDQIAAAKYLATLPYVDKERIGIWGWSFGGYLTSLCLLKGADIFKMGIAVAPVTSWRFYDTIYTERFLNTPQNNPKGYDDNSPINFAEGLKGKLLIVHGTGDDNVHVQNVLRLQNALIKANKQFDAFFYPDRNHGIYGGNTRLHLYQMMTNYIVNNL